MRSSQIVSCHKTGISLGSVSTKYFGNFVTDVHEPKPDFNTKYAVLCVPPSGVSGVFGPLGNAYPLAQSCSWGAWLLCVKYDQRRLDLQKKTVLFKFVSSLSSREYIRLCPKSGLCSGSVKTNICCGGHVGPLYFWACMFCPLLLFGKHGSVTSTFTVSNLHACV